MYHVKKILPRAPFLPIRVLCFLIGMLLTLDFSHSQTLHLQSYTEREGLPSNLVSAIFQDARGYLWIGTKSGLARYDGARFVSYSVMHGLPNNWVTAIAERPEGPGTLIIGTIAGGLCEYHDGRFRQLTQPGDVNAVLADRYGAIWFIMNDSLFRLQGDTVRLLAVANVYPEHGGIVELSDRSDSIRYAAGFGNELLFFSSDGARRASVPFSDFGDIYTLEESPYDSTLWLTGLDGRICQADRSGKILRAYKLPQREPATLARDGTGTLWLRTVEGVRTIPSDASLFDPAAAPYAIPDLRPGRWVGPLMFDREDNLWAGTWARGLLKVSDRRIVDYPLEGVVGGTVDAAGTFWLTMDSCIVRLTRSADGSFSKTSFVPDAVHRWEGDPALDGRGNIWVVGGRGKRKEYLRLAPTQRNAKAVALVPDAGFVLPPLSASWFVDREQRCWIPIGDSAIDIVDLSSQRLMRTLSMSDGLPRGGAKLFFQDHNGNVWIGMWSTGLIRCDLAGSRDIRGVVPLRRYTVRDGLPQDWIRALHEDADGNMWIGTRHGGLARLGANGAIASVSMGHGLRSNSVWKIATDRDGRVWLLTDAGVECIESASMRPLGIQYKLRDQKPLGIGVHRDEYLWMVSPEGVSIFEFQRYVKTPPAPLVAISSFRANDEPRRIDREVTLNYDQNNCVIDFAGLAFADERSVRFRYRLLGLDSAWRESFGQRAITYAALNPGSYAFEVVAVTSEGAASAEPARVRFRIAPPFYRTWWFGACLVGCIGVALRFMYQLRVRHLLDLERLRMRIAGDLHDDVGTNLGSIIVTSQLLERRAAPSLSGTEREQIREIGAIALNTQEMMRDIVWMLNPENEHVEDLIVKMKEIASRLLPGRKCEFRVAASKLTSRTSIDFKRNVLLVFKEALHNVLRHAEATCVVIDVRSENGSFLLQVSDDGKGFDPSAVKRRSGLANMQRRAAQLGGSATVRSIPGKGTTVRLTIENHAIA